MTTAAELIRRAREAYSRDEPRDSTSSSSDRQYTRGATGTPTGGQFATTAGTAQAKPKPTAKPVARKPAPKATVKKAPTTLDQAMMRQYADFGSVSEHTRAGDQRIKDLQALMAGLGIKVAQDGRFGPEMTAATKALQTKVGSKPTGRVTSSLFHKLQSAAILSPCARASEGVLFGAADLLRRAREGYNPSQLRADKGTGIGGRWVSMGAVVAALKGKGHHDAAASLGHLDGPSVSAHHVPTRRPASHNAKIARSGDWLKANRLRAEIDRLDEQHAAPLHDGSAMLDPEARRRNRLRAERLRSELAPVQARLDTEAAIVADNRETANHLGDVPEGDHLAAARAHVASMQGGAPDPQAEMATIDKRVAEIHGDPSGFDSARMAELDTLQARRRELSDAQAPKAAEAAPFVPKNPAVDSAIRAEVARLTGRTDLPSGGMLVGNPDWGIPMTDMHQMFRSNGNVYVADLRDALGEKYSRAEVDAALKDMVGDPSIRLMPIAASTSLSQRDRDSALHMGGTSYDLIKFETPEALPAWRDAPSAATPAPKKTAAAKMARAKAATPDPAETVAAMRSASSRDEAAKHLEGRSVSDLRAIAASGGIAVGNRDSKDKLKATIVQWTAGQRLDSEAVSRPGPSSISPGVLDRKTADVLRGGTWDTPETYGLPSATAPPNKAAPASTPRADLGAMSLPELRAADVNGDPDVESALAGRTVPELRRIAYDANINISPAAKSAGAIARHLAETARGHDKRNSGQAEARLRHVANATPRSKAPKATAAQKMTQAKAAVESPDITRAKLAAVTTREEARALLSKMTVAQLKAIHPTAATKKADVIESIVERTVGARINSDVLRQPGTWSPANMTTVGADPLDVAEQIGRAANEAAILPHMAGMTVADLRKVARELSMPVPKSPTGWTADELRQYIATVHLRDRARWNLR